MLLMTKEHFTEQESLKNDSGAIKEFQSQAQSPHTRLTQFIPSSRQIVQFAEGREPKPDDKIVYVDGAFDLFRTRLSLSLSLALSIGSVCSHIDRADVGHIGLLEKAKALGDYLIVGVHTDQEVNRIKGSNLPIMNLLERVLGVLSCRVCILWRLPCPQRAH